MATSQKLLVDGFNWKKKKEKKLKFNEDFIKNYNEDGDKGYILEVDIDHHKEPHDFRTGLPFLVEKMKINELIKLVCNCMIKMTMLST